MKDTSIEWADNTINFTMGCTKVSKECEKCYMYRLMLRFGKDPYKINFTNIKTIIKNLKKWESSIIFVDSMSDFWHKDIPDEKIAEYFKLMNENQKHTFLLLTKRAERMNQYLNKAISENKTIPKNIWFGVSCGIKESKNRIKLLRSTKVENVKFVSFEPLLENLGELNLDGINWAIVGGESDRHPRAMQKEWVDELFEWCTVYNVGFFFKQWGGSKKCECHKAWGCRLYDGKIWNGLPILKKQVV